MMIFLAENGAFDVFLNLRRGPGLIRPQSGDSVPRLMPYLAFFGQNGRFEPQNTLKIQSNRPESDIIVVLGIHWISLNRLVTILGHIEKKLEICPSAGKKNMADMGSHRRS